MSKSLRQKYKFVTDRSFWVILFVIILNVKLRIIFVNYAYIPTDEGIALYNTRLAYQGLRPFIDYNGWNSLINDYLFGIPQLIIFSTILTQRYFALLISMLSLVLALVISYLLAGKRAFLWSAIFISVGSLTYTYHSNRPYSTEMMTFGILLTFYFVVLTEKVQGKRKLVFETGAFMLSMLTVLIRSQMLPLVFIIWFLFLLKRKSFKEKFLMTLRLVIIFLFLFVPFLIGSWKHTIYGLFWPFFASKILVYVAHTAPRSLTLLSEFFRVYAQDYGLLTTLTISLAIATTKNLKTFIKQTPPVILAFITIIVFFIATALIHTPADASYIYPGVPLFACVAAFFMAKLLKQNQNSSLGLFISTFVVLLLGLQFITYPHFKIMKTQLSTSAIRPYDLLKDINQYVLTETTESDKILTFYLPAVANINRHVPIAMNEGQGSLTILDDAFAKEFHLTSIPMLHELIRTKQVKLILFTDTFTYYFGQNDIERRKTLELIQQNYVLGKEFTDFKLVDGSKATSLQIYHLPKE